MLNPFQSSLLSLPSTSCWILKYAVHFHVHSRPNQVRTFFIPIDSSPFPSIANVYCFRFPRTHSVFSLHSGLTFHGRTTSLQQTGHVVWVRLILGLLWELMRAKRFLFTEIATATKTNQNKTAPMSLKLLGQVKGAC